MMEFGGHSVSIDKPRSMGMWIMIGLGMASLIAMFAIMLFVNKDTMKLAGVMPGFNEALEKHDYTEALAMYRDLNDTIINRDPGDDSDLSAEYEILTQMEATVNERVTKIEEKIRYERYTPTQDDIAFLEGLSELTGARMTNWLTGLCEEFLRGTIEKPTLMFIFDQLENLSNISAAARPLRAEINQIELSRGDVQSAESLFAEGEYIEAVKYYEYVISTSEGFVNEFANKRLEDCKVEMYDPMMEIADHMLANFQYYSAETLLSDLARIFPDDQIIQSNLFMATSNTYPVSEYKGSVEVICVKPLIADTTVAFELNYSTSTDSYYLTVSEFRAILESLYAKDYCLIDPTSMVDLNEVGFVTAKEITIPQGKKPLVIILEDFSYTATRAKVGMCQRLVLNDMGQVCGEYVNAGGQTIVSRNSEAIGILDAFVEEHPDFSFNGVKGVISLTGYQSILGYVTDADQVDDRNNALEAAGMTPIDLSDAEIEENRDTVISIIEKLTDSGWIMASSTYGFINANHCELPTIQNDTEKWLAQVGAVTGPVSILVYPNGDFIRGSDPRCVYLKDQGFRVFFGAGPSPYYTYGDNYLYFDRCMLTGDTLRNVDYSRLFNKEEVYDANRKKSA
ncbi:MAG: hypothetical protein IJL60_07145 [Clostridiales bacterium]|nr:hypothetical protein [Clostridiales bacterium]